MSERPAPPIIQPDYPPCPICGEVTYHDGDGLRCDDCRAWWSEINQPGQWLDPTEVLCPAAWRPFKTTELADRVYRCILADGHGGDDHVGHYGDRYGDDYMRWSVRRPVETVELPEGAPT